MKRILAVLISSSTAAGVAMFAKSDLVFQFLWAALRLAAAVLPAFARIIVKFIA